MATRLDCRRLRSLGAVMLVLAAAAVAGSLATPTGPVILTVDGDIGIANRDGAADLDRNLLEGMGTITIVTTTPWTDTPRAFTGVPFARLVESLGARGEAAVARALNDYVVTLPVEAMRAKEALLALRMDGEALSVRDKGPIWIVFPWDQRSGLDDQVTKHQSIWQLRTLTFE